MADYRTMEIYEAATLNDAVAVFLKRYSPMRDDREFEAAFVQIVQRIYREAQKPFLDLMMDAATRRPVPFVAAPSKAGA